MMNKLRTQIVMAFNLFILLILGGAILFYVFFAENYYIMRKQKIMNTAFQSIHQFDLTYIQPEDEVTFLSFEEESFGILICNENFECIYSSKIRLVNDMIQQYVKDKQELYSVDAKAVYSEADSGNPIALYGLIHQGGGKFYVYIYENTRIMHKGLAYANNFLLDILILVIICGTFFAYGLAFWIGKPVINIQKVTNRLAQNDFSVRLPDKQPKNEIGHLAGDINHMADNIQRNINDLNNYAYLLLKQNREMAEFEDMRKKLVSNITHELKTPLAIISSQVELLQYEYDHTKKDYYFSSIMEEIDKMSRLISSILQNSRMENKIQNAVLKWENLSDLITTLLPKYENWLTSKKIRFSFSIEEDCMAYIDSLQIEQAINNYMMNACRHTKAGRNVVLSLKSQEDCIYLSVYNDGPRLPEQELDRIWTGFYQTEKQNQTGEPEIGLGLYIVKDIMSHHNGSCGVLNQREGVEFWMRFPRS